jgi:hypothetical protein
VCHTTRSTTHYNCCMSQVLVLVVAASHFRTAAASLRVITLPRLAKVDTSPYISTNPLISPQSKDSRRLDSLMTLYATGARRAEAVHLWGAVDELSNLAKEAATF